MTPTKTRLSTGDLMRELGLSRARLERVLRDWGRELPVPELVAGCRLWRADDLDAFRVVIAHDEEMRG